MFRVHIVALDVEERHPQLLVFRNIVKKCTVFAFAFKIPTAVAERGNELHMKTLFGC